MPLAGAEFRLGREPRSAEEPHAGAIYMTESGEVFGSGQGDNKVQAYALLATIKDFGPNADKAIPKPGGYDAKNYAPEPLIDTWWFTGGVLPNSKYELNENLDGTDVTEINWNYITGGRGERRRVWETYRDYTLGYIYSVKQSWVKRTLASRKTNLPATAIFPTFCMSEKVVGL